MNSYNCNKTINEFIDEYNRRYKRLYEVLLNNQEEIIILSVNHFDDIYSNVIKKDDVLKLYNLLYSINKNIKLIAINYCNENLKENNIEFINLEINKNLEFVESKELFVKKLYEYISNTL